jgi:hypothetical protein
MKPAISFHERFGGETSLEQDLIDLGRAVPRWIRPVWSLALRWILPWLRDLKIRSTLESVDQQSSALAESWLEDDRIERIAHAAAQVQAENPDATVKILSTDRDLADPLAVVIAIERPPVPGDAAQELLGFSSIELRAPWTVQQEDAP